MTLNEPEVSNYREEIPKIIFSIYKSLKHRQDYKLDMDFFSDQSRARAIIKQFMDRGAYIFCSFRKDFLELKIFRNDETDGWIKEYKEEQVQRKEN